MPSPWSRSLGLAALVLLADPGCGQPAASPPQQRPEAGERAEVPEASVWWEEILQDLREERRRAGIPPPRFDPRLSEVAREHAEAIARSGVFRLDWEPKERVRARFERAGYTAARWVEGAVITDEPASEVVDQWKREERQLFRDVLDGDLHDVGLGRADFDGRPLYVMVFAQSRAEQFSRDTAGLSDLEAVRAAMLARVNAERRRAGQPPLAANARLDQAAQRHAQDMLARGFFDHVSPEGKRPRDRAAAARYTARAVAENIASGQTTVDAVMDGWMSSPGHRRNLLDGDLQDLGVGLALGAGKKGEDAVWVQLFGSGR